MRLHVQDLLFAQLFGSLHLQKIKDCQTVCTTYQFLLQIEEWVGACNFPAASVLYSFHPWTLRPICPDLKQPTCAITLPEKLSKMHIGAPFASRLVA